jgi:thiol-disulfide isomerase/thioredoxin
LAITPQLNELSEVYQNVSFVSADVEAIKELVGAYLVFVYPTVIIFAQGKETQRFERVFSIDDIERTVARYDALLNG